MKVTDFPIEGPRLIEMKTFGDERGFFVERFNVDRFENLGIPAKQFIQDNFSRSSANVLRGLHYQFEKPQAKLVTALSGKIFDVIVDIRSRSATFGQHLAVTLDGDSPSWLWVPAGFAHGFLTLSERADVMYKVDAEYNPRGEAGLAWNDPHLQVQWPTVLPFLSSKDERQGLWADYIKAPKF